MQAIYDFLAMGGHAGFVWPAFLVFAVVLTALWLASARGLKGSEKILDDLNKQGPQK